MDRLTSQLTHADAERIAQELAWIRPLGYYPNWTFDCEWSNPELAFQFRQAIWRYFSVHAPELPFVLDWHDNLRIQTYWGTDESKQIYIGGCAEPNELAFLAEYLQPGMAFFDVGANNGLFSLLGARRVGRLGSVWAFEPSRREFGRLQANLRLNSLSQVRVEQLALANFNDTAEMKIADRQHTGQNTLGCFCYDTTLLRTEVVTVRTIDRVAAEAGLHRIDLIKIDAEGAEWAILDGARSILHESGPVLMLELFPKALEFMGSSPAAVLELLREVGYLVYEFDPVTGRPMLSENEPHDGNIIAAPRGVPIMADAAPQLALAGS